MPREDHNHDAQSSQDTKEKKNDKTNVTYGTTHHYKYLYNFDTLKPHFYIVKLGFTVVYIILLISVQT